MSTVPIPTANTVVLLMCWWENILVSSISLLAADLMLSGWRSVCTFSVHSGRSVINDLRYRHGVEHEVEGIVVFATVK